MRKTLAVVASVVMLTGVTACTTTEQSAAVGGLAGAAIGGATTGKVGGAVAGGLIGTAAGVLVGQAAERGWCVYRNRWGYSYRALCPR